MGLHPISPGLGVWKTYTPTLTAVTTPPTMGSGATQNGRYIVVGSLVVVHISIRFGTGAAAGSGIYSVDLPVAGTPSDVNYGNIGFGNLYDASANVRKPAAVTWNNTSRTSVDMVTEAATNDVAHNVPWTWGDTDQLYLTAMYEAAT